MRLKLFIFTPLVNAYTHIVSARLMMSRCSIQCKYEIFNKHFRMRSPFVEKYFIYEYFWYCCKVREHLKQIKMILMHFGRQSHKIWGVT